MDWFSPWGGALASWIARPPASGRHSRGASQTPPGKAGVRRQFAPDQLRHGHAVEMSREDVPFVVIENGRLPASRALTIVDE